MLKANTLGLLGAATLGMVMLSPAMTLYGTFGPTFSAAGNATPLAFCLALLATAPTALSYALVARDHPSSGVVSAWIARAISPALGAWAGWMVFLYYALNFVVMPVSFGLFFSDLVAAAGLPSNFFTYAVGVLLGSLIPASIVYRGIAPSTKGALALLVAETAIVVALCVTVIVVSPLGGSKLSTAPFHLAASPEGVPGLFKSLVFGMLGFCGFDVISTLSEETKMARKLIPQATLLSLLIYGGFIIGGMYCLTYADTPQRLNALANGSGMPITQISKAYWGRGSILIVVTGLTAALGICIACAVGASRVLFSMGRAGFAPKLFARVHERFHVPWQALHVIFAAGLCGPLLVGALASPYTAFVWFCTTTTYFAMITYLLVNLANLLLNRGRAFTSVVSFLLYVVVPSIGVGVDGFILVRTFFIELWRQGWATGQSVIAFDAVCSLLAALAVLASGRAAPLPTAEAPLPPA
jgi:amino acid transporter